MEELKKGISDMIRSKITPAIEKAPRGWPPTCDTYIYQMERPYINEEPEEEN